VRIHIYAHIRTIAVSTGVKLIRFYFLHLLPTIYFSITMHRCPGKKVRYATDYGEMSEVDPLQSRGLGHPVQ
jgi:hypothetical protein